MAQSSPSMMFELIFGLIALSAMALMFQTTSTYAADPDPSILQTEGKAIYDARCASCHGLGGVGTPNQIPAVAPPLSGNLFVTYGTPAALRKVIRNGRTGWKGRYSQYPNMPSFDATMIADLRPLIAYLKGEMQQTSSKSVDSD